MKIFKNIIDETKKLDTKYGLIIKIYLILSIVVFSILILVFIANIIYENIFNNNVPIFNAYIRDVTVLNKIVTRLNEENIKYIVTPNGLLLVDNKKIAARTRWMLTNENLIPANYDHWIIYEKYSRNITDFERNVFLMRAREIMIKEHIKTIEGIHDVGLTIVWTTEDNSNASVSLILIPEQLNGITKIQQKIEGIQEYLINSIEGLLIENIVIVDQEGYLIMDFM